MELFAIAAGGLSEIAKTFGVPLGLVIFFVLRNAKREDRLMKRFDAIDDYVRTRLEGLSKASTAALVAQTETSKALVAALERRRCIADDVKNIAAG